MRPRAGPDLDAVDARWVDAASASLHRAGRAGLGLAALGVLIVAGAFKVEWFSAVVFGAVLAGLGIACSRGVGVVELRIRTDADELADVVAVRLSRNPASLGEACVRLAGDELVVARPVTAAAHSWFKLVGSTDPAGPSTELRARSAGLPRSPGAAAADTARLTRSALPAPAVQRSARKRPRCS